MTLKLPPGLWLAAALPRASAWMAARERNPVLAAPLWPQPEQPRGRNRSSQRRWGRERCLRLGANQALQTLQAFVGFEPLSEGPSETFGHPRLWEAAGPLARSVPTRLREFMERCGPGPTREEIDVARGRLFAQRSTGMARATTGSQRPARGDTCPLKVELVELPPPGRAVPLCEISPTAKRLFSQMERLMLAPDGPSALAASTVKPYLDPALRQPAAALALARRMWAAGMLRETPEFVQEVPVFAVVKKVVEQPDPITGREFTVKQRLIFDDRAGNLLWRDPPWVPLSGPAPFSCLDFSGFDPERYHLDGAAGDISNWYYRLLAPDTLAPYFVLPGVVTASLRAELVRLGFEGPLPDPAAGQYLGVVVLVMGWKWAVYLAHTALTEIAQSPTVGWPGDRLLIHGVSPPTLLPADGLNYVLWLYIDDFGALSAEEDSLEPSVASRLQRRFRDRLTELGFLVHKEQFGAEIVGLGMALGGPFWEAAPEPESLRLLAATTSVLLELRRASPREVSAVVGGWTWRMLLARPALACWSEVYAFTRLPREHDVQDIPPGVLAELAAALSLRPLLRASWLLPLNPEVCMTDASPSGGALVVRTSELEEIRSELPFVTQGRWLLRGDWLSAMTEATFAPEGEEDDADGEPTSEDRERVPKAPKILVLRFCYLCSGPRRPGDFEEYLEQWSVMAGVLVIVDLLDLEVDPPVDLLDSRTQDEIRAKARAGWWHAAHGAPPCSTWSPALFSPLPDGSGPRPYRDREHLWGLPGITGGRRQRCLDGSRLLLFTLEILTLVCRSGPLRRRGVSLEHPADRGRHPFPSIWATEEVASFEEACGCRRSLLDQCRFDAPSRKPTCLSTNLPEAPELLERTCNHRGHATTLIGKDDQGGFRTTPAARYPPALCRALVEAHFTPMLEQAQTSDVCEGAELREVLSGMMREAPARAGARCPVQAVGPWVDDLGRWREAFRLRWERVEASNIVEGRMLQLATFNRARAARHHATRILLITDNLAALAVLSRGRSSVARLLGLCRAVAGVSLGCHIRFLLRWVESRRNHADGPSRQCGLGYVAPSGQTLEPRRRAYHG